MFNNQAFFYLIYVPLVHLPASSFHNFDDVTGGCVLCVTSDIFCQPLFSITIPNTNAGFHIVRLFQLYKVVYQPCKLLWLKTSDQNEVRGTHEIWNKACNRCQTISVVNNCKVVSAVTEHVGYLDETLHVLSCFPFRRCGYFVTYHAIQHLASRAYYCVRYTCVSDIHRVYV